MYRPIKIDIVINRDNYFKSKYFVYYYILILLIFCLCLFLIKIDIYMYTYGTINDEYLEIILDTDDLNYIKDKHQLYIDNTKYSYRIKEVSQVYIDNNYRMYQYVSLDIFKMDITDNFVYLVKLLKERKSIGKYIIDLIT